MYCGILGDRHLFSNCHFLVTDLAFQLDWELAALLEFSAAAAVGTHCLSTDLWKS